MASTETLLAQQPTRVEPNDPSNVQSRNETIFPLQSLVNDNDASQPQPIGLFQQDLINMNPFNPFNANKTQILEEQHTSRPSDRTQDKEQRGQQSDKNVFKSQANKTSEFSQERN